MGKEKMNLATLNANVNLDITDFEAGVKTVKSQMNSVKEGFDDVEKAANDKVELFAAALGGVAEGFTEAVLDGLGTFILDFAKDSIEYAAEIESAGRLINTVFGDEAASVRAWASGAVESFGLASGAAQRYAANAATIMSGFGMDTDAIYESSTALVELAGDLSAFYGMDFDAVWNKLTSGLRGNTEAIEDLSIFVNATTMESKFGKETWKNLTEMQKSQMRLQHILESGQALAGGYYAKNKDTYSAQLAEFNANIAQLKQTIGEGLLPIATDLLTWFNGIFGGAEDASSGIDALKESSKDSIRDIESTTSNALALVEALERLSASGDEAANADTWNAVLAQLQETIPGIGNLINAETGKIEGGAKALREYINTWRVFALEQAKQKAVQGMYDEYAEIALDIVELQNDQYIADTLEANAQKEQDRIVIELAKQAFAQQQETAGWSVTDDSFGEWQRIAEAYLQTGNKYHLEAGSELTGGMSLDDLGGEYVAETLDEFRRWMEEEKEYAKTDNAASIAERQALLDRQATEIETLSAMYEQALEQASKSTESSVSVSVYLDGQEVGDIITERVESNMQHETSTRSKTGG